MDWFDSNYYHILYKHRNYNEAKNFIDNIIKYLNKSNNFLKSVKEVYFTEIKKGYKKGWIKHTKTKCFLLVIEGKIRFFYTKNLKRKKCQGSC